MIKNKNVLKVCNSSSEFFITNISEMSAAANTIMQCKNIDDLVILEDSDLKLMNLEISKQKLKSLQKQHKLVEIMIKITKKQ